MALASSAPIILASSCSCSLLLIVAVVAFLVWYFKFRKTSPTPTTATTQAGSLFPRTTSLAPDYSGLSCQQLQSQFGIVPNQTWGNASSAAQSIWVLKGCDSHFATTTTTTAPPIPALKTDGAFCGASKECQPGHYCFACPTAGWKCGPDSTTSCGQWALTAEGTTVGSPKCAQGPLTWNGTNNVDVDGVVCSGCVSGSSWNNSATASACVGPNTTTEGCVIGSQVWDGAKCVPNGSPCAAGFIYNNGCVLPQPGGGGMPLPAGRLSLDDMCNRHPELQQFKQIIIDASNQSGVPGALIAAAIMQESGGNPKAATVNPCNCHDYLDQGLLQCGGCSFDPNTNIRQGAGLEQITRTQHGQQETLTWGYKQAYESCNTNWYDALTNYNSGKCSFSGTGTASYATDILDKWLTGNDPW